MESGIFSAEGRIRRSTYWTRWLIVVVINVALAFMFPEGSSNEIIGTIFTLLAGIFLIIQGVKRMHDVDKSGWYIIIPIYSLILCLTDGTAGPNQYGDDPKGRGEVEDEFESATEEQ